MHVFTDLTNTTYLNCPQYIKKITWVWGILFCAGHYSGLTILFLGKAEMSSLLTCYEFDKAEKHGSNF